MVRVWAFVDRKPEFLAVGYVLVQTNVARDACRAAAIISQYMTLVQPNLLWTIFCDRPGVLCSNNGLTAARQVFCIFGETQLHHEA